MIRIVIIVFITLPLVTSAQSVLYLKGVAGWYNMKDMKGIQNEIANDFMRDGIQVKITSEFPASLQQEFGMDYQRNDAVIGFFVNYTITKGRMHYGDYSGETFAEQNITRIATGFRASKAIQKNFNIYGKIGINYSLLDLAFATHLNGASEGEEYAFTSFGLTIEPGFQWQYTYHRLVFLANFGYELAANGKVNSDEIGGAYLMNSDGDPVLIDWSGVRVGLGVGVSLYKDRPMH